MSLKYQKIIDLIKKGGDKKNGFLISYRDTIFNELKSYYEGIYSDYKEKDKFVKLRNKADIKRTRKKIILDFLLFFTSSIDRIFKKVIRQATTEEKNRTGN